jgi:hypothetical protein
VGSGNAIALDRAQVLWPLHTPTSIVAVSDADPATETGLGRIWSRSKAEAGDRKAPLYPHIKNNRRPRLEETRRTGFHREMLTLPGLSLCSNRPRLSWRNSSPRCCRSTLTWITVRRSNRMHSTILRLYCATWGCKPSSLQVRPGWSLLR